MTEDDAPPQPCMTVNLIFSIIFTRVREKTKAFITRFARLLPTFNFLILLLLLLIQQSLKNNTKNQ